MLWVSDHVGVQQGEMELSRLAGVKGEKVSDPSNPVPFSHPWGWIVPWGWGRLG